MFYHFQLLNNDTDDVSDMLYHRFSTPRHQARPHELQSILPSPTTNQPPHQPDTPPKRPSLVSNTHTIWLSVLISLTSLSCVLALLYHTIHSPSTPTTNSSLSPSSS